MAEASVEQSAGALEGLPRILLVEDEPGILIAVTELLRLAGYEVQTASNGREALAALETFRPDAIVSDIVMPEMDGYQFFQAVRARPEWLEIPFIFLTGKDEKPDVRLGKQLGADDYVTKPFDHDDLLISIRAKLRRRAELDSLAGQRARSLKRTILNTLTHEFRTPLTSIAGYLNLLDDRQGEDRFSPQEFRAFMRGIRRGSDRLGRLVEDFILLVELETGEARANMEARRQPIADLGQIVTRVAQEYSERAAARSVGLQLDLPATLPTVDGDPALIANALGRLVDNAVKFSKKGGGIVGLTARAEGEGVRIAVSDRGVGFAAEHLPRLFDPFTQINRAKQEQQGSGSGLAIAQGIARLHGGAIHVESREGKGSTFTLELPVTSGG